ncbi:MAG: TfoX/Sxy family protein [Anaerolineaceae bacterium]
MASTREFVDYVTEQLAPAGKLHACKMFGEYGLYLDGKFIGLICSDQFFLKKTTAGAALLGAEAIEGFPYAGAKSAFLFDSLEDKEFLCELLRKTWQELPEAKPKPALKLK